MSWRKHFTPVSNSKNGEGSSSVFTSSNGLLKPGPASSNYSSHLPDVYVGSPNRVERYGHYNVMDLDSEVNAGLDILAEFCTQKNKQNGTSFSLKFNRDATTTEVTILTQYLKQWYKIQQFSTRMFRIIRNTFKYGDEVFIRDPQTKKLFHVDVTKIRRIIINESEGKIPEQYVISDVNFNFKDLVATNTVDRNNLTTGGGASYMTGGVRGLVGSPGNYNAQNRFSTQDDEIAINAEHIVHLSLSEGLDENYPFGNSLLETIFKVYKQKELLEDSIIIYRVQRAPERRVFYVDVGNMPSHLAMQFVERVKTEIHQRRIPSKSGGNNSIDSSYNPLCIDLQTEIPLLDGSVQTLDKIIERFENGEKLYAYSCDPSNGNTAPGLIDWAGVTRKNAEVIELTFNNGKKLICTPDHKFPVYNQGLKTADELDTSCALFVFDINATTKSSKLNLLTRIVSKKKVKNRDTGTLTIDKNHIHHDYHTFAVNAGVYIKNSINEDFFFPQTCLSLDTTIPLLDGRTLNLEQVIEEYKQGKINKVYGLNNKTQKHEPAEIKWAGVTRKNTQVVKVNLDNGESVIATPDHRFITRDCDEVEAQDLKVGNELMTFMSENTDIIHKNHKVICVEWLEKTIDTCDITIESNSNSHLFALSAGIYVHNSEGRGSKVETLPGGNSLGEISDLKYFTNKLVRGLRIPSSYLPTGDDDGTSSYNDGRVGTAYIQELRFNTYCERLQGLLIGEFDLEFKRYLIERGVNIDTNMFELEFEPPQNFASYRQAELDNSRVPTFTTMSAIPFISNRFALKRFLGMTEEEIAENQLLWMEENEEDADADNSQGNAGSELGGAGLNSSDLDADMSDMDQELPPEVEDGGMNMEAETGNTDNEPPPPNN